VPVERFTIDPVARSRQIAESLRVPYVDVREAFEAARAQMAGAHADPAPLYIFFDYQHPDAQGHARIAQAVAHALEREIASRP